VLQMPQMRGVMTSASLGSRPTRICSKPPICRPHAPGVSHHVPVDFQLDFDVAFDTVQIHLDNSPRHFPNPRHRRNVSRVTKIPFRIVEAPVIPSSDAPPGGTATC